MLEYRQIIFIIGAKPIRLHIRDLLYQIFRTMELNTPSYWIWRRAVSEIVTQILSLTAFRNVIHIEPLFYAPVAFLRNWA